MRFQFLDPGPLIDQELTLVPPHVDLIDEVLAAVNHPLTVRHAPEETTLTRQRLLDFCKVAPQGRQPADLTRGWVPAYHFWMRLDPPLGQEPSPPDGSPAAPPREQSSLPFQYSLSDKPTPPLTIAGGLGIRIGTSKEIELYSGNIGYHVYPPARGHHYAARAVQLIVPLLKRHGLPHVWITTNPENIPSRKTCEYLGATLIDIVRIPKDHPFQQRGETAKCRYLLRLD